MCYYNGIKVEKSEFIRLKNLEKAVAKYDFLDKPLHNGFDYGNVAVLKRIPGTEDFEIVEMEWGYLPPSVKNRAEAVRFRSGYQKANGQFQPPMITLNAKGEELLLPGKMYREAALSRRCLALSSGFFDWQHVYPISKKTGKPLKTAVKYPYHIKIKGVKYFFIAAIWTGWTDQDTGEYVETVSYDTTDANEYMAQIHNSKERMPTILPESLAAEWLFGDLTNDRITELATFKIAAREMEGWTVRKDFRTAADPTEPFEHEGCPAPQVAA